VLHTSAMRDVLHTSGLNGRTLDLRPYPSRQRLSLAQAEGSLPQEIPRGRATCPPYDLGAQASARQAGTRVRWPGHGRRRRGSLREFMFITGGPKKSCVPGGYEGQHMLKDATSRGLCG
jgi:hypothetical protein